MGLRARTSCFLLWVVWGVMGCAAFTPEPQQSYDSVLPKNSPVRNLSNFSASLHCMDDLLTAYGLGTQGGGKALLTSQGIVDKTGKNLGGDNREMLIATVSQLAARSEAFVFVNYNPRDADELQKHLGVTQGKDFTLAQYEIAGAITQLDENVSAASLGASLAFSEAEAGLSKHQFVTVLGVDFSVNHAVTRQTLNGVTASNRIVVTRHGKSLDGGGRIQKAGLFFHIALERNEGLGAALRTLVELSTIEILGKLAKVPYWQCLQIEHTNPEVLALTADWFHALSTTERVTFVQQSLRQLGYTDSQASGILDEATQDAIARYQAATALPPSGRIDVALYRQLISPDLRQRLKPGRETLESTTSTPSAPAAPPKLWLTLTTPRGPAPVYKVNEHLELSVEVSRHAYVYCYYRDGHQRVTRIFPNQFQSNPYLRAQQPVTVPPEQRFALLLDTPNTTEEVRCIASAEDLAVWLPQHLRVDLQALPLGALEEVAEAVRRAKPRDVVEARLAVRVQP